jgi:hypothetical protein
LALLATAYDRPVDVRLLAKLRRVAELWTEGDKALAHIHLAYARLAPSEKEQALRRFVADELIEAGVTPETLMKAQGFDPATLALLKVNFNQAQPSWPAASGRDSGEWKGEAGNGRESGESTSDDATITPVAFRHRGHGRRRGFDWIRHFLELFGERRKEPAPEEIPREQTDEREMKLRERLFTFVPQVPPLSASSQSRGPRLGLPYAAQRSARTRAASLSRLPPRPPRHVPRGRG